jgi:predicted nucleic-acid-binding protein
MKKPAPSYPDTNAIVRYLMADDPVLFERAKAFFDHVRIGEIDAVILESIIAECIYVLTKIYKVPKDRASESLIGILRYKGIVNDDRLQLIHALSVFSQQRIDIVDCILYAKTSAGGCTLFTFDKALNKLIQNH